MDAAPRDTWKDLIQYQDYPQLPVDLENRVMLNIYEELKLKQSTPIPYSIIFCCFLLSLFLVCFSLHKYDPGIPFLRETGMICFGTALIYFLHSTYDQLIKLITSGIGQWTHPKKELAQ